jgi:phage/plasmid primase-like uncharacterized protein
MPAPTAATTKNAITAVDAIAFDLPAVDEARTDAGTLFASESLAAGLAVAAVAATGIAAIEAAANVSKTLDNRITNSLSRGPGPFWDTYVMGIIPRQVSFEQLRRGYSVAWRL